MQEEMESLNKNMTWEIVDKPSNARLVGCKWVFKGRMESLEWKHLD
ncbi:unnamed protein product [Rhodiola kirilowii]